MTQVAGEPAVLPKQVVRVWVRCLVSDTEPNHDPLPTSVGIDGYPLMGPKGESYQQF